MATDYKSKVDEIAEIADEALNEWECEFISDVSGKTSFSDKQKDVIDRIYAKVCESSY